MKMMMKIINNNKFHWFAICDFEIFGRIGRSFICMWEARDSRKMGFGCFSFGDITFLAFRAKAAVLFAFLPQMIIPSRWMQSTSAPTPPPSPPPPLLNPLTFVGWIFSSFRERKQSADFCWGAMSRCHHLKKVGLNFFLFLFFFSPFPVLSVYVTSLVVFHFTKQLVWWINIFFESQDIFVCCTSVTQNFMTELPKSMILSLKRVSLIFLSYRIGSDRRSQIIVLLPYSFC